MKEHLSINRMHKQLEVSECDGPQESRHFSKSEPAMTQMPLPDTTAGDRTDAWIELDRRFEIEHSKHRHNDGLRRDTATMASNSLSDLRLRYDDFLRSPRFAYADRVAACVDDASHRSSLPRLRVPLSEIRGHDPTLSNALLSDPSRHLRALETVAHDVALEERPGYDLKVGERLKVAIGGPVTGRASSPRELGSSELRRLICVEGVAVKVSPRGTVPVVGSVCRWSRCCHCDGLLMWTNELVADSSFRKPLSTMSPTLPTHSIHFSSSSR